MNAETMIPDSTLVDIDKLPWVATRFPGIDWKILMKDEKSGMFTALMRWAPGAGLPDHVHTEIEQTYVLQGSFGDHSGVCRAGQFVWRRAGSRHEARTDEGCLMLAMFLKPNKFFD